MHVEYLSYFPEDCAVPGRVVLSCSPGCGIRLDVARCVTGLLVWLHCQHDIMMHMVHIAS